MAQNLSPSDLTKFYNSPVQTSSGPIGPFGHSGVKVTLQDKSGYGKSSQTVGTPASSRSSNWKGIGQRDFAGTKTVGDFVKVGGTNNNVLFNNCHQVSGHMMK